MAIDDEAVMIWKGVKVEAYRENVMRWRLERSGILMRLQLLLWMELRFLI